MTWYYLCFYFVRSHVRCSHCFIVCWRGWAWGCGFVQNLTSKVKERRCTGGGGSWKLDNFHGRYTCIVPNQTYIPINLSRHYSNLKGATKSYFTHYMLVIIILFNNWVCNFYQFFCETTLSVFHLVLCLFCIFNFDVIFTKLHNNNILYKSYSQICKNMKLA